MATTNDQPGVHRDGTMIAGGNGSRLSELAALGPLPTHSCGLDDLDRVSGGGILPGQIWTLAAQAGAGATMLATQIAVSASRTGQVLLANGHMGTHLLRDRVLAAADALQVDVGARARLMLASWEGLPSWETRDGERHWGDSQCAASDVVVLDTLDEMWRPPTWPTTPEARLRSLRWLREIAQGHGTAVLLTARVPPGPDFDAAWQRQWAREVFADVADVRLELRGHRDRELLAYLRGRGWWDSALTVGPRHDRFYVLRPPGSSAPNT